MGSCVQIWAKSSRAPHPGAEINVMVSYPRGLKYEHKTNRMDSKEGPFAPMDSEKTIHGPRYGKVNAWSVKKHTRIRGIQGWAVPA